MKDNKKLKKRLGPFVAIDCGVRKAGLAIWKCPSKDRPTRPTVAMVVHNSLCEHESKPLRAVALAQLLTRKIKKYVALKSPVTVVIEWPEFRAGNAVGHAAAAKDDLTSMAANVGAIMGILRKPPMRLTYEVPVSTWKGQLPKQVVSKRIERAIGRHDCAGNEFVGDAWDAVGIGLWALGFEIDDERYFANQVL